MVEYVWNLSDGIWFLMGLVTGAMLTGVGVAVFAEWITRKRGG